MDDLTDSELLAHLAADQPEIHRYRGTMDVHEKLTVEAYDCARRGDFDEARHRLHLRDKPKFWSEDECWRQYNAAMIETRRAREACA